MSFFRKKWDIQDSTDCLEIEQKLKDHWRYSRANQTASQGCSDHSWKEVPSFPVDLQCTFQPKLWQRTFANHDQNLMYNISRNKQHLLRNTLHCHTMNLFIWAKKIIIGSLTINHYQSLWFIHGSKFYQSIFNNYWMMFSVISRIVKVDVVLKQLKDETVWGLASMTASKEWITHKQLVLLCMSHALPCDSLVK